MDWMCMSVCLLQLCVFSFEQQSVAVVSSGWCRGAALVYRHRRWLTVPRWPGLLARGGFQPGSASGQTDSVKGLFHCTCIYSSYFTSLIPAAQSQSRWSLNYELNELAPLPYVCVGCDVGWNWPAGHLLIYLEICFLSWDVTCCERNSLQDCVSCLCSFFGFSCLMSFWSQKLDQQSWKQREFDYLMKLMMIFPCSLTFLNITTDCSFK